MVELALVMPPEPDDRWDLAKQVGVDTAVVHALEIGDDRTEWNHDRLQGMQNWFQNAGIEIGVIEGSVPVTDTTRLGLEGRDAEIEQFKQFLRDCGDLGIDTICYDWMAGIRWARTNVTVEARGGSLTSEYDVADMPGTSPHEAANVTHEELWANLEHFLEEVVPVAEEAGVTLGLHPDDPPREDVKGIPRIVNSVEAYDRVLDVVESEYNGITFCQGNFAAMGVDVPETIRHFGDRINFAHFRDVRGDADAFVETWHDDGPTDMLAVMEAYDDVGFDGPIRPDHVPTMAGEDNSNPGYHTKGRLWAIGYMRGLLESVGEN
ncbi:mannonate dehydratase [Salinarchaeum laminariae]|uniref:mannonate dehydratase n=1 Tax=Salinarchaeum laminariae TaxID=869888 RepID=UPI0020BFBDDF|nr:mannonate dehydratase [Salinarchaeum laminariae]